METIQVELWGAEERPYTAEFVGRWLVHPDPDETRTSEPGYDAGGYYGVALTEQENLAIYWAYCNEGRAPALEAYSSFKEAEEASIPGDILATAASELGGGYARKLDI
jgi:hypothetical protein